MSDLNTVSLVGRLTHDAEVKVNGNGTSWMIFSLANNYCYSHNNEKVEEVSFFRVKVWGKMAESLKEYLVKGKQIGVAGRLRQHKFKGDDDKMINIIEVVANQIQLISSFKNMEMPQQNEAVESDVPF